MILVAERAKQHGAGLLVRAGWLVTVQLSRETERNRSGAEEANISGLAL